VMLLAKHLPPPILPACLTACHTLGLWLKVLKLLSGLLQLGFPRSRAHGNMFGLPKMIWVITWNM
jgi:hypothetical protein